MSNLEDKCFFDNILNDNFVGIRKKDGEIQICFPIGFNLDTTNIKKDIQKLVKILLYFNTSHTKSQLIGEHNKEKQASFPFMAYKNVIDYYIAHGYYTEYSPFYSSSKKGKINFAKTIKKNKPIFQKNNSIIYTDFQVKNTRAEDAGLITKINKYCVYEAFSKIGFLFGSFTPEEVKLPSKKTKCLSILKNKLHNTFDDKRKLLLSSMQDILLQHDDVLQEKEFKFGTTSFHTIWEKMIDIAFGIDNKQDFFPQSIWKLDEENDARFCQSLQPDTIMIFDNKIYVIDAKYYKYSINSSNLPGSRDIAKQIIYGEYVSHMENEKSSFREVFNAFLIPYNGNCKETMSIDFFKKIGYATMTWRQNKQFEKIQGILIDTRFLFYNYDKINLKLKKELVQTIES